MTGDREPVPAWHWSLLPTLGLGIFLGAFWLLYGYLRLLGSSSPWWHFPLALAPGTAVVWLVLLARRHPLPYGTALAVFGLAAVVLPSQGDAGTGLIFGLPLVVVGAAFIVWRRNFRLPGRQRKK